MKIKNYANLMLMLLALSLVLFVGCSRTKQLDNQKAGEFKATNDYYHINLPNKMSDELCMASSIADTVIYVPLETNSQSLLGHIWIIAINDSCIVVSDKKRIMTFQRNGKFIAQIGRSGKGPGEFTLVSNILLKGDTLYIASLGKKELTKYTVNGKYIGAVTVKQDSYLMRHLCEMPNGGYAWYDKMNGNIVYFDNKLEITDTLSIDGKVSKNRELFSQSNSDDNFLVKTDDKLLFNNYRNDTIWDISSKVKKTAIIFNLKEKLLPDHLQVEYTQYLFLEKAKSYQRINFMQTDSFVFILQRSWSDMSKQPLFFVYNRTNKEIKQYKKPVIHDDISGDETLPLFFYFDNTIFSFVDYSDIVKAYEKAANSKVKEFWGQQLAKVSENSNYMLVIIKTK